MSDLREAFQRFDHLRPGPVGNVDGALSGGAVYSCGACGRLSCRCFPDFPQLLDVLRARDVAFLYRRWTGWYWVVALDVKNRETLALLYRGSDGAWYLAIDDCRVYVGP